MALLPAPVSKAICPASVPAGHTGHRGRPPREQLHSLFNAAEAIFHGMPRTSAEHPRNFQPREDSSASLLRLNCISIGLNLQVYVGCRSPGLSAGSMFQASCFMRYRELDVDDFHQDSALRNFDHVPTGGALAFGVLRWDGQAHCMDVPFYLSCSSAAGAGLHSNVTLKTGVFVCAAMASLSPRLQVVPGSEYLPGRTRLCHTRKLSDETAGYSVVVGV